MRYEGAARGGAADTRLEVGAAAASGGGGTGGNTRSSSVSPLSSRALSLAASGMANSGASAVCAAAAAEAGEMTAEELLFETTARAKQHNRNHFGLLGILKVIKTTDVDLNVLALGTDLTTLGYNLNSTECLYGAFTSPISETPVTKTVEDMLPQCYVTAAPVPFRASNLERLELKTLLYIFYSSPRLLLQIRGGPWRGPPNPKAAPGWGGSPAATAAGKQRPFVGFLPASCFLPESEIRSSLQQGYKEAEERLLVSQQLCQCPR
ncbi:not2 not3 not5 family protein [Cyclospora cayetanensis]|uniref:Not2 not3 not5 family protein n=1 Tax=Cyclospora cayetanensis TaxID=88456 RepID=A0A1D3CTJ4_9EIME|nr:not2 not3 not5 family protein [Cyclospora cayetanensis]